MCALQRNAFISVISSINGLLQATARSLESCTGFPASNGHECQRQDLPKACHSRDDLDRQATDTFDSPGSVCCCPSTPRATQGECGEVSLEVLESGVRVEPTQRVDCLENFRTPQLLRHALLLWMGAWLMKSCRPALRYAVLDHFIAQV